MGPLTLLILIQATCMGKGAIDPGVVLTEVVIDAPLIEATQTTITTPQATVESIPVPPSSPVPSTVTPAVQSTAHSEPASIPTPVVAAPILFYDSGDLLRTDVIGGAALSLAPVFAGGEPGAYFYTNPPRVSPDGRWLLVSISTSPTAGRWQLFDVMTGEQIAAGGGQSRISPAWSPDSAAFAYLDEGGVCIYSIEPASETCIPVAADLIAAAWSPDGATIALVQMDTSIECCRVAVRLFAVDENESFAIGVIEPPPQANTEEFMEWTDGRLLLKSTSADVPSILYNPVDGATLHYEGWIRDVSPDGRLLLDDSGAVIGLDGATAYVLPANEACPRPILTGANWAWSPEGKQLAFLLNCAAASDGSWLYVVDATTGEIHWDKALPLPAGALYPLDRIFWSPDGTYLLLDGPDTTAEFTRPLSPVWRLAADGSGELEVLKESGYLVDVVAAWSVRQIGP